ncbi:MAG: metallophosphoesterase [Myxococcota bacterium]|nr:metallophosphoesterase [Myxococcota bacterium]
MNILSRTLFPILILGLGTACTSTDSSVPPAQTEPSTANERAIPPPTFVDSNGRLIAMGDVHGDYDAAISALKLAGAIDDNLRWIGGDLTIVQTGDQLDRGDQERAILDLFERIADEAHEAGGAFYSLLGNHESMNVELDLRYVTPGGFVDFADIPYDANDPLISGYPEEQRGRVAAFRPGGPYAEILAGHNVVMVVDDTVFIHGGLLPSHVTYGLEKLNQDVQAFFMGNLTFPRVMEGSDSPVWSRHFSDETDVDDCALLDQVLDAVSASRMVVGHTVQRPGITSACDGKVWRIDVGMAAYYDGVISVLEIVGDEIRIIQ